MLKYLIMFTKTRIGLNRIIYPKADLEEFFRITSGLGLKKVELRNDLPGRGIIDGLPAEKARDLLHEHSLSVLTINALQKFNVPSLLHGLKQELKALIGLARSIDCTAIVLCPNNDRNDGRPETVTFKDTVDALKIFSPLFEDAGLRGYMEPLGFAESSLRSLLIAQEMIREAGSPVYKIVHDTFHHHLGPARSTSLRENYDISLTGLVHASGVEDPLPVTRLRDEHRILVGPLDRLQSKQQISLLLEMGYEGDICFEPFSGSVQNLAPEELKRAIEASIRFLLAPKA